MSTEGIRPSWRPLGPAHPGVRVASSGTRNGRSMWALAGECAGCGATMGPHPSTSVGAEDGARDFLLEHRGCGGDFRPVVSPAERDRMIADYVDQWARLHPCAVLHHEATAAFDRAYRVRDEDEADQ